MKKNIFITIAFFACFHLFGQEDSFSIQLLNRELGVCNFEFYKYSVRTPTQQVFLWNEDDELEAYTPGPVRTYRGRITNHPNYKAFAVWYPDGKLFIKALTGKGENDGIEIGNINIADHTITRLSLPIVTEPQKSTRVLRSGYSSTYKEYDGVGKDKETLIAMWENGVNLTDYFTTRDIGLSITCDLLIIPTNPNILREVDIIKPNNYPEINKIEMFWKTTGGGGGAGRREYCKGAFHGGRSSIFKSKMKAMPHEIGHTLNMPHYLNQIDAMHANQFYWGRTAVTIATAHLERDVNSCLTNANPNYTDPLHPWTAEDYRITNKNTAIDIDVLENDIDYNGDVIS